MSQREDVKYNEAYSLYLKGLSLEQVGKKINTSRQCVFEAFVNRGFVLRSPNLQPSQMYDGKKFTLRNHGYLALTTEDRCLMHRYVWMKEKGEIPIGWDIHHKDRVRTNNTIENLDCISKSEHARLYSTGNNQFTKRREVCK